MQQTHAYLARVVQHEFYFPGGTRLPPDTAAQIVTEKTFCLQLAHAGIADVRVTRVTHDVYDTTRRLPEGALWLLLEHTPTPTSMTLTAVRVKHAITRHERLNNVPETVLDVALFSAAPPSIPPFFWLDALEK